MQEILRIPRISLHTALAAFLILILLLPVVLGIDLLIKALHSEKDRIEKAFFLSLERSFNRKKMQMIDLIQAGPNQIMTLASDSLLAVGDGNRFGSVATEISRNPYVNGVFLLRTDGSVLHSSGSEKLGTFQVLLKSPHENFVQSTHGIGFSTNGVSSEANFLCVAYNSHAEQMERVKQWADMMNADTRDRLFVFEQDSKTGKWHERILSLPGAMPQKGAKGAIIMDNDRSVPASFSPSIDFPASFNPEDPKNRTFIVSSGSQWLGCFLEKIVPKRYYIMIRNAAETEVEYQEFLSGVKIRIVFSLIYILLGGILFSALLAVPIGKLAEACDQIESGDYLIKPPYSIFSEIERLSVTFTRMAHRVGSRIEGANQELLEKHRKLMTLFESVSDGIFLLDPAFRISLANSVARRRMGILEIPPEGAPLDDNRRILMNKIVFEPQGISANFRDPLENKWYKFVATHLVDHTNAVFGYVVVERDITLEKEIDRMKTEFVSNVSHELRTPLTSIQAYAEMLVDKEAGSEEQAKEYLEVILQETERLARLVNDVLDISRIESGRQIVRKVLVKPGELVAKAARIMERWAQKKKQTIETRIPEASETLEADRDMMEQALLNLVSNSIKYSPEGERIFISFRIEAGHVLFSVKDNGIGMSESEKENLFSKFFRAENDTVRKAGGTGLGLVLVNEIVRLHQGRIEVSSSPGKGAEFTVRIPLLKS